MVTHDDTRASYSDRCFLRKSVTADKEEGTTGHVLAEPLGHL